jgi:16S rRNA (guanine966-N2)-methyltransferase
MKRDPASQAPQQVRLIGGQWKRSILPVVNRPGLRPTPQRVRETLFNWLGQDLTGWRCLDAFAGSGALGFEAASRGAASVVMVEQDGTLAQSLQASQERLNAQQIQIHREDAVRFMLRQAPVSFELILLDPPFDAALWMPALKAAQPLLVTDGFIYLEAPEPWPAQRVQEFGLQLYRQSQAGAVHYHLLQSNS